MALTLNLTIEGTVGNEVMSLLVNNTVVPLTNQRYVAMVPVTASTIVMTQIDRSGRTTIRTIQLTPTESAAG